MGDHAARRAHSAWPAPGSPAVATRRRGSSPVMSLFQTNRSGGRAPATPGAWPRAAPDRPRLGAEAAAPRPSGPESARWRPRSPAGEGRSSRPGRRRRGSSPRTATPGRRPPRRPRSAASARTPAASAPAAQEVDGPGGVAGRGTGEVRHQGSHLLVGGGRLVERRVQAGEVSHAPSPASSAPFVCSISSNSPSKRVCTARASTPCS